MNFSRPQRLVTLVDFLPKSFLRDHQDRDPEVIACHAINAIKEGSILSRSLEEERVLKDHRGSMWRIYYHFLKRPKSSLLMHC